MNLLHPFFLKRLGFLLLIVTALFACDLPAQDLKGKIVGVHDGNSITLLTPDLTQFKVRLEGVDAPELKQPFGQAAKRALSDLVFGKDVQVSVTGQDRYKRTLGTVYQDGVNVNLEMVRQGFAWRYDQYSKDPALLNAQQSARNAKRGLWQSEDAVPPWEWRKLQAARRKK